MQSLSRIEFGELRPEIGGGVAVRHYGNEAVAWSDKGEHVVALDSIAALIIQFLDGTVTMQELIEDVCDTVGVPESIASTKLRRTHERLLGAGLLALSRDQVSAPSLDLFPGPPNP